MSSASVAQASIRTILFSDHGCPFAHRVLALLEHLGQKPERREAPIGCKPEGLARYSPSGRIPLLVHGDLAITQSLVILQHLADHHGFAEALPNNLRARTLHRHAMAMVDEFLAPRLFGRSQAEASAARLDEALTDLEDATATVAPHPCLLALHVAPIWLRFRWWRPTSMVTQQIEARADLCAWLDACVQLDCLVRTAPNRASDLENLARAREAGLLPADDSGHCRNAAE